MSIWSKWLKRGGYQDEPEADQEKDAREWMISPGLQLLPGCDVAPEGRGPFGYGAGNPIPANGPIGELIYLNTLLSPDGKPFLFHRLGSMNHPTYPRMIDAYELVALDGRCWCRLYFDMYFKRRSCKFPEGLQRVAWDQLQSPQPFLVKHCGFGLNQPVEDFPYGLPAAVRQNSNERATEVMARIAERVIAAQPDSFRRPPDFQGGLWTATR